MRTRMNRRQFTGLAAAPLLLSGCSLAGDTTGPDDEVTLWYWNRSIDESLFRQYEQEHPNITIDDQKVGGDYASKFNTMLAGKAYVPDIVALNDDVSRYFPDQGNFVDLQELGAKDLKDQYLDWKWNLGVTPEGKMIAFPMDTGPTGLFYRADIFEEAGLPTEPDEVAELMSTWEDYFEQGVKLQEAVPTTKLFTSIGNLYLQQVAQLQTRYVNSDGVYTGNSDQIKQAWDRTIEAYDMDLSANVNDWTPDWSAAASNGGFASFVGAVWMKQPIIEAAPNTRGLWRVTKAPGGPGNQGGSFIGITSYANDNDLAWDIIKNVQSPEGQVAMYKSLNLFPSALAALDDPIMDEPEDFFGGQATAAVFADIARELKPFYFSPAWPIAHGLVSTEVVDITVGGGDRQNAWEDVQARVKKEIQHKAPWVTFEE